MGRAGSNLGILQIFSLRIQDALGGLCLGPQTPESRLMLELVWPVLPFAQLALVWLLHTLLIRLKISPLWAQGCLRRVNLWSYRRTACSLLMLAYQPLLETCMIYLNCVDVEFERVVFEHPDFSCDTAIYHFCQAALLVLLIGPICFGPLVAGLYLWKNSGHLRDPDFIRRFVPSLD